MESKNCSSTVDSGIQYEAPFIDAMLLINARNSILESSEGYSTEMDDVDIVA